MELNDICGLRNPKFLTNEKKLELGTLFLKSIEKITIT